MICIHNLPSAYNSKPLVKKKSVNKFIMMYRDGISHLFSIENNIK